MHKKIEPDLDVPYLIARLQYAIGLFFNKQRQLLISLVFLKMPYYRIIIWTKRKLPFAGIRHFGDTNINAVYNLAWNKANSSYRNDLIDIEVQMLSKLCSAVKEHIKKDVKQKPILKT